MGYPTGEGTCWKCDKPVIEWDCGTPGHACHKEWTTSDYEGRDRYEIRLWRKARDGDLVNEHGIPYRVARSHRCDGGKR